MGSKSGTQGQGKLSTPMFIGIIILVVLVIVIAAVMIGRSDNGQINVSDVINNSNSESVEKGGSASGNVGTTPANLRNLPNGGLIPKDNQRAPTPPSVVDETDSGTTTEEDGLEDEDDNNDVGTENEEDTGTDLPAEE